METTYKSSNAVQKIALQDLPYSTDAEKSVLSSILIDNNCLLTVEQKLCVDDFYHKSNQIIYRGLLDVSKNSSSIDLVVLAESLHSKGVLSECGGPEYLIELQAHIPCVSMIEQYCKIIKDKSILRRLIINCSEIIRTGYSTGGKSVQEVLDRAENLIFQLTSNSESKDYSKLSDLLKLTFEKISKIADNQGQITGVPTGFESLDNMTCGMQNGDLLILAARPSMGKTAMALNIALNAWAAGFAGGIFSLEMSWEQLVLRIISSESGICHQRIRSASISSEEWIELTNAAARIDRAEIFIDDTAGITISELRTKARRMKLKHNIKFLIIDYLQLICGDGNSENRNQEISSISRALKALAKELDLPIIALSQLSRSLEGRVDKRPMLSDLRESGAIEQDGDVIMFIYRDIVYNKETEDPDSAEVIIGKQRNGPTGTVNLHFDSSITRFK